MRILLPALPLLVLALLPLQTLQAADKASQTVILAHVRVIDGTGAPPKENMFVTIFAAARS